jgi:hypothetical protein
VESESGKACKKFEKDTFPSGVFPPTQQLKGPHAQKSRRQGCAFFDWNFEAKLIGQFFLVELWGV